jgi:hypothetical protein
VAGWTGRHTSSLTEAPSAPVKVLGFEALQLLVRDLVAATPFLRRGRVLF